MRWRVAPCSGAPDAMATASRLYQERQFYYIQAQASVDAQAGEPALVARKVAEVLGLPFDATALGAVGSATEAANDNAAAGPTTAAARSGLGGAPRTLHVMSHKGSYGVHLAPQIGSFLDQAVPQSCRGRDVLVLTDRRVEALHAEALVRQLRAANKRVEVLAVEAHENSKSLEGAARVYEALSQHGFGRDGTVVALGGGMVGDLAGFVAATYMRGIGLVSLPTSTLAAVDSSIGGKTALNLAQAKNVVGTFYPPDAVFIGVDLLQTQSARQHAAGLVEVVKMAATHDKQLFAQLQRDSAALLRFAEPQLSAALLSALQIKASVVQQDEHDRGGRAVLNFGHTIGHAIELGEAFRLLHGEAVALGMLAETAWGVDQHLVPVATYDALCRALQALQVPVDWRRARVSLQALRLDKKRQEKSLRLPLVVQPGSHSWHTATLGSLAKFVA